jgi:hypothetical protein
LRRYGLIIVDEVGYLPFSGWGGVFGDQAVAAAMIDRIVHHADVLTLKGASYRLRGRGIDSLPSIRTTTDQTESYSATPLTFLSAGTTSLGVPSTRVSRVAEVERSSNSFCRVAKKALGHGVVEAVPDRDHRPKRPGDAEPWPGAQLV